MKMTTSNSIRVKPLIRELADLGFISWFSGLILFQHSPCRAVFQLNTRKPIRRRVIFTQSASASRIWFNFAAGQIIGRDFPIALLSSFRREGTAVRRLVIQTTWRRSTLDGDGSRAAKIIKRARKSFSSPGGEDQGEDGPKIRPSFFWPSRSLAGGI